MEEWCETPRGTVAAVIVLDQLSRNLRRGTPEAFALDARALGIAKRAIAAGVDRRLRAIEAVFLYLPFEHSESLDDQVACVALYTELRNRCPEVARDSFTGYISRSERCRVLIERFGRFPHRNPMSGRSSTPEEIDCVVTVEDEDLRRCFQALDCYVTFQETIEKSGIKDKLTTRAAFEIFQEDHDPSLDDLFVGLD